MSAPFATVRTNVRYLLGDMEPSNYAVNTLKLDRELIAKMQECAARSGAPMNWTDGSVNMTANSGGDATVDANVTGSSLASIVCARILETDALLEKRSPSEIIQERAYPQGHSGPTASGDPTAFAVFEDEDQVVKLRWNRVPGNTRTVSLFMSEIPADISDNDIPLPDLVLRAIEKGTAAACARGMAPDVAARIGLGPNAADGWDRDAERLLVLETERKSKLTARPYGVGKILGR